MSKKTDTRKSSVDEMFDEAVARNPAALAIECGERQLSYGELLERSNSLANYLISHGAGRESIVAILTGDTCELIVGILGTLKAGAAFMPLDVRQPVARLRKLLKLAPPQFLLTETSALAGLGQLGPAELQKVKMKALPLAPHLPFSSCHLSWGH